MAKKKNTNKKTIRQIILYTDEANSVELSYSVETYPNSAGRGFYMDEIYLISEWSEDYIKEHVKKIFVGMVDGDEASSHYLFCRDIVRTYSVPVVFNLEGLDILITKDTPDDWWDMSLEDAIQLHRDNPEVKQVGPYYVNLTGTLLKKSLWLCSIRITTIQDVINKGIQLDYPDLPHTWRDEFKNYAEYRNWNTEKYTEVFVMQRRIKRYCDLLRDQNDSLTQADVAMFKAEFDVIKEQTESEVEDSQLKRRSRRSKKTSTDEL